MAYKTYEIKKQEFPNSLLFVREGSFYACYNYDADIVNYFFKYRILNYPEFRKVLFPFSTYRKVAEILRKYSISISIVDEENNFKGYIILSGEYEKFVAGFKEKERKITLINDYLFKQTNKKLDEIILQLNIE